MAALEQGVRDVRTNRYLTSQLLVIALGALLGLTTLASAQTEPVGLRSTTRLVRLNVVVSDPRGDPVRDLNEGDFTILDDGRREKITYFQPISESPLSRPILADSDSYTNQIVGEANATVLLFDTLNSRWTSQGYALARVRRFLREIAPEDHIGIYVLGDRLWALHDIIHDDSDLVRAVRQYERDHGPTRPRNPQAEGTGDMVLDHFLAGGDNRYSHDRNKLQMDTRITAAALNAIARQLSAVRGRKEIIWVTDSIGPLDYFTLNDMDPDLQRWYEESDIRIPKHPTWRGSTDIEQMIRLMNSAGIEVYTVDAEGLQTEALGLRTRPNEEEDPQDFIRSIPQPNPDLLELAKRTGGRAFFNRNDLETGIRRAVDDSRFTYSIAYVPHHNDWKGEWRKIRVEVDRPDVTVLARSGYFALPDPEPIAPKDRFQFLTEIAASPVDSGELTLTVHISEPQKGADEILATVGIPPRSLATMLTPEANGHTVGHFELMFMQIGAKDKLLDVTQKQVDADLKPDDYSKLTKGGWTMTVRLPVKLRVQTLCVILHDESTDAVGSIHIPMTAYE